MQAKATDKEDELHFKAGGGGGVDALGHGALYQAAGSLDNLAMETSTTVVDNRTKPHVGDSDSIER